MEPVKDETEPVKDETELDRAEVEPGRDETAPVFKEEIEPVEQVNYHAGEESISPSRRDYILARHGTLNLDPLPSEDPDDPYNWPQWRKNYMLLLFSFHAFMVTYAAGAIIPAFGPIHEEFGVTIATTTYLLSLQILLAGLAPLLWEPISNRYGRRPMLLVSSLFAGLGCIGCAISKTYALTAFWRCWQAFFISPPLAMGSTVVVEMFFQHERAKKLGIWTLFITLGPPTAPLTMGFVAQRFGFRWIYWILTIINFVQFALYLAFRGEPRYLGPGSGPLSVSRNRRFFYFKRIDHSKYHLREFYGPLLLVAHPKAIIPAFSQALVFTFVTVFITAELPEIYIAKFNLKPQQLGLQFVGMIIGSVIGEQLAGPLSDWWMQREAQRHAAQNRPPPRAEHRLWLTYLGFALGIAGVLKFGIITDHRAKGHWSILPLVGMGIGSAGVQIVITILVTYVVDTHPPQRAQVGSFMNVVRSTFGFICPFFFPEMIHKLGPAKTVGILGAAIAVLGMLPVLCCQVFGGRRLK